MFQWLFPFQNICDAMRQNESQVAQITFLVFYMVVESFLMPHSAVSPMNIGWLVPEIQAVEGLQNNRKQRKFFFLIGYISKSMRVLTYFASITSHISPYVEELWKVFFRGDEFQTEELIENFHIIYLHPLCKACVGSDINTMTLSLCVHVDVSIFYVNFIPLDRGRDIITGLYVCASILNMPLCSRPQFSMNWQECVCFSPV